VTRSVNGNKKDSVAIQFQPGKNHFWETESRPGFSDDYIKNPDAALCCILRRCGVRKVRLTPQDLHALPADFLRSRPHFDFLRVRQI